MDKLFFRGWSKESNLAAYFKLSILVIDRLLARGFLLNKTNSSHQLLIFHLIFLFGSKRRSSPTGVHIRTLVFAFVPYL